MWVSRPLLTAPTGWPRSVRQRRLSATTQQVVKCRLKPTIYSVFAHAHYIKHPFRRTDRRPRATSVYGILGRLSRMTGRESTGSGSYSRVQYRLTLAFLPLPRVNPPVAI